MNPIHLSLSVYQDRLGCLISWVEIRLYSENQLPWYPQNGWKAKHGNCSCIIKLWPCVSSKCWYKIIPGQKNSKQNDCYEALYCIASRRCARTLFAIACACMHRSGLFLAFRPKTNTFQNNIIAMMHCLAPRDLFYWHTHRQTSRQSGLWKLVPELKISVLTMGSYKYKIKDWFQFGILLIWFFAKFYDGLPKNINS